MSSYSRTRTAPCSSNFAGHVSAGFLKLLSRMKSFVSFRHACVRWRFGCELRRMGSLSHVFREQGIHIVADTVAEVVADDAYLIQPGD